MVYHLINLAQVEECRGQSLEPNWTVARVRGSGWHLWTQKMWLAHAKICKVPNALSLKQGKKIWRALCRHDPGNFADSEDLMESRGRLSSAGILGARVSFNLQHAVKCPDTVKIHRPWQPFSLPRLQPPARPRAGFYYVLLFSVASPASLPTMTVQPDRA